MTEAISTPEKSTGSLSATTVKALAVGLLIYVLGLAAYALTSYSTTKSKLLTYGLSDATANLIGLVVMFVALGLPALALFRIAFWRPRLLDYGAALLLPTLSWGIAQMPAKFDAVTGEALQYCAPRPDGTTFCLDRPGVDPLTQRKLVPIDSRTAEDQFRRDRDLLPRRVTTPVAQVAFFDALSGESRIWYSKNDGGCYDLFDNPGVNPQTGERLEPVSKTVVHAIRRCASASSPQRAEPSASTPPRLGGVRPASSDPRAAARTTAPLQSDAVQSAATATPQPQIEQARRNAEAQLASDRRRQDAQSQHERDITAIRLDRQRREAEAKLLHQQRVAAIESEFGSIVQREWGKNVPYAQVLGPAKAKYEFQKTEADLQYQQELGEIASTYQKAVNAAQTKLTSALAGPSPRPAPAQ